MHYSRGCTAIPATQVTRYLYEVPMELGSGPTRELLCWQHVLGTLSKIAYFLDLIGSWVENKTLTATQYAGRMLQLCITPTSFCFFKKKSYIYIVSDYIYPYCFIHGTTQP